MSATASGGALPVTVASASRASRRHASARASFAAAAGLRQARAARCSRSGSGGRHRLRQHRRPGQRDPAHAAAGLAGDDQAVLGDQRELAADGPGGAADHACPGWCSG